MRKIIVESCSTCPYFMSENRCQGYRQECSLTGKTILTKNGFPEFCPLEKERERD
jgi:hypothetical protein